MPACSWLAALLACHLGLPPGGGPVPVAAGAAGLPAPAAQLTRVEAPVAEPGLGEDLRRAVTGQLAARGALGPGPALELLVLAADSEVVAVDGETRVHRARLVLEGQLLGHAPRRVVLRGERSYEVDGTDGLVAASQRALAFRQLAEELGGDLVAWALYAPSSPATP